VAMSYLPPVLQVVLALVVVIAAVYDVRYRRIPNWLTLSGVLLGLGVNWWVGSQLGSDAGFGVLRALKGLGLAFVIYFPLYILRGMGAGDVKLMSAVGAIAGAANWFGIFILTNILGGIVAVCLLLSKGRLRNSLGNLGYMLKELAFFRAPYMQREELDVKNPKAVTLPHGLMIMLGSIAFLVAAAIWAPK